MRSDTQFLEETDRKLLLAHYSFYKALHSGERSPSTPAQRHFVEVCEGKASPETEHERAYSHFRLTCEKFGVEESEIILAGFVLPLDLQSIHHLDGSVQVDIPVRLCLICRRPINPERLEAMPATTRCVACQQKAEASSINSKQSGIECPRCAERGLKSPMVWRIARDPSITGYFLGCSRFPECRFIDQD